MISLRIAVLCCLLSACGGSSDGQIANDPIEPETSAELETTAEPNTSAESEADTEPNTTAEPETDTEPNTTAEPETASELDASTEPETSEEPDTPAEPDTVSSLEYGLIWRKSPYDNGQEELDPSAPLIRTNGNSDNSPMRYQHVFDRERELHGYNPRFIPSRPYFDKYNLPWIYGNNMNQLGGPDPQYPIHVSAVTDQPTGRQLTATTYDQDLYADRYSDSNPCERCDAYIQRLTKEGKWVFYSIKQLAEEFGFRKHPLGVSGDFYRRMEQIYFQNNGDVFLRSDHGVLHFRESSNSWIGYPKNWIGSLFMAGNGDNPPLFINNNWPSNDRFNVKQLIGTDQLEWKEFEIFHNHNLQLFTEGTPLAWVGNTLHIAAFNTSSTIMNRQQYNSALNYVRYNLDTGATDVEFMGWSGSESKEGPDNHNYPVMLADSKNYIHFLSGAHGHQIWHRTSLKPVTDSDWGNGGNIWPASVNASSKFSSGPETPFARTSSESGIKPGVDYVGDPLKKYTYVHTKIDSGDRIHISTRKEHQDGDPDVEFGSMYRTLNYIVGIPRGNGQYQWEQMGDLVVPNWNSYSVYAHKLTTDRRNHIYVSYKYQIAAFSDSLWYDQAGRSRYYSQSACETISGPDDCVHIQSSHNSLWPDEPLLGNSGQSLSQPYSHDLALIGSADGGESWTITTTEEFLSRMQNESIGNVVGY